MNQQIAHRNVGVAQVGAEDVFAEEFSKFAAGRMTAEEGAALMSRAVKLGMAVANIFFEAAEERREDGVLILLRKGVNLTAIELGIVTLAVNDASCTANQARIYFAAFIQDNNRNAEGVRLNLLKFAGEGLIGRHDGDGNLGEVGVVEVDDFAFAFKS